MNDLFYRSVSEQFCNQMFSELHSPIDPGEYDEPNDIPDSQQRLNHYLIKSPSNFHLTFCNKVNDVLIGICKKLFKMALNLHLPVYDRYVYVTYDNDPVTPNGTQREPGWHIDGMQGAEVPIKMHGCYQLIWCDILPTEFAVQTFNAAGLDPNKHNYFNHLGFQVKEDSILTLPEGHLCLMNSYMVHKAKVSKHACNRKFLRIYITHQPITSVKATLNDCITYPFIPHSTSGNIPIDLI